MLLRQRIFGIKAGNFRPSANTRAGLVQLISLALAEMPTLETLIAPQADFTNRVINCDRPSECQWWNNRLGRSIQPADGGFIHGCRRAVGYFNGDCPLLCLWQDDRLAVLHAGYRCLIRETVAEENIVQAALRHFDLARVKAWMGLGIGPCCWVPGYASKPEILHPNLHPQGQLIQASLARTTEACPGGAGHVSVDLSELATLLLADAGVPMAQITVDRRCTCCWREDQQPVCWSLTRAKTIGGTDGRNLVMAWLE